MLACASMCQYREAKSGNCNAFKFKNQSLSCEMAELSFLEDPGVGQVILACDWSILVT